MSVQLMSFVFHSGGLTPTQKLVMLALADHANEEGRSIYPSVKYICFKTALGERTVRRTLVELRGKMGLLRITNYSTLTHPNEYAINVKVLKGMVAEPPATVAPGAGLAEPGATVAEPGATVAPKSSVNHQVNKTGEKDAPPADNSTAGIKAEYENLLGHKLEGREWSKGEGAAAKRIGEKFTLAQLRTAYQHYKAQPFWGDKRLTLGYMEKNMGELLANRQSPAGKPRQFLPEGI